MKDPVFREYWESNHEWMPLHEPSLASIMNVQLAFSNVPFLGLMRPTRATGAEVFDCQSVLSSKLVSSFVDCMDLMAVQGTAWAPSLFPFESQTVCAPHSHQ